MDDCVTATGALLFIRSFGVCVACFAHDTLPAHLELLNRTALVFPYAPWHHLPLAPMSAPMHERLRNALLVCGFFEPRTVSQLHPLQNSRSR